jgi:hypothetical protein
MYVNVARAAAALVALLAIQVLPVEAQSSVRFRPAAPAASAPAAPASPNAWQQSHVVAASANVRLLGTDETLGPPVQPPEILPPGGETISPAPAPVQNGQRTVMGSNGTVQQQGEVIYDGCPTCGPQFIGANGEIVLGAPSCMGSGEMIGGGGCPTCGGGEMIVAGPVCTGGDCAMCNSGCAMCNHGCRHGCGGCGCGGCNMCGGCNHGCGGCNSSCHGCAMHNGFYPHNHCFSDINKS